ncbi:MULTISPECIES: WXG100 family type VII secretion target [unclassified Nocardia]|uniref:WXG100 family type VII secretion target n=1 Tax=unclassified Nocardia TaxID=2637762 RepID=UPI001CE46DDA|nr:MULTISPECIES: WXG100 family type VII secretion target [unclassified Nocardia]
MAHRYDLAAMERFVTDLDGHIRRLAGMHEAVGRSAADLRPHFVGDGGDGFSTAHADWQSDSGERLDELRALRTQVHTAHHNYAEAERLNREMFGFAG